VPLIYSFIDQEVKAFNLLKVQNPETVSGGLGEYWSATMTGLRIRPSVAIYRQLV